MRVTRRFQFCAGHRVFQHESKCAHPHGHNYVLFATFEPLEAEHPLDPIGRVIDFSVIKDVLGMWIDTEWDHGFIYSNKDLEMCEVFNEGSASLKWNSYVMEENPTAENMAAHLINEVCPQLFKGLGVVCTEITLWETENCSATVRLKP